MEYSATTITFGDAAENHVGMQQVGSAYGVATSIEDLQKVKTMFEEKGGKADFYNLRDYLPEEYKKQAEDAAVLVMPQFLTVASGGTCSVESVELEFNEMLRAGKIDTTCLLRGKVMNKRARHNNVIADFDQEPDIANGKGTVVNFAKYPAISRLRDILTNYLKQPTPLVAEVNHYYNTDKCSIGMHGDSERNVVAGFRFGASTRMPLHFQAYRDSKMVGPRVTIDSLAAGTVYIMSRKATGNDWKKRSILTWRHAAGPEGNAYVEAAQKREAKKAEKRKHAETGGV